MKTLEHRPYGMDLTKDVIHTLCVHVLEVVRHQELTLQLSQRPEADPDETAQLNVTHPTASFGKVG